MKSYQGNSLFNLLRCLALACLMTGAASSALAAKTYSDNGDGTVTDPTTGLVWMRCAMRQTWNGSTCTSTASGYTWSQANALTGTVTFAGHGDWRLPNIRELLTIVDWSVVIPAIDTAAFPNTPASYFWSASASAVYSGLAWYLNFDYGGANNGYQSGVGYVRLVRSGQPLGLLNIARPNTDYVDQGDGTVMHTPTGLVWQRCSMGQTWMGTTCTGTASTYTWIQANALTGTATFAGKGLWRVPTEDELLSLVDYSIANPAINVTLFPNTPASAFWSASAFANDSNSAWSVFFSLGYVYNPNGKGNTYQVRLVRSGQPFLSSSTGLYDGIYLWSAGNFLSLHQDGTVMIATIYFTNDGSFSFPATSGAGVLPVPQLDIFDLMSGQVVGSAVRMTGTRFHRACNVTYDFTFNSDATITVTRVSATNTATANAAGISCSAIVGAEPVTLSVPKIRFN